jgi:hypothetical protein
VCERHARLLEQYAEDLRKAKAFAEAWWGELIDKETRAVGDTEEALTRVRRRWRVGPAAHPRVIAVIRRYYFACDALNLEIARERSEPSVVEVEPHTLPGEEGHETADSTAEAEQEIPPKVFLGEMLLKDDTNDLGLFINGLIYVPIGIDLRGNLV